MSVVKALEHASMRCGQKLDLQVRNDVNPQHSPLAVVPKCEAIISMIIRLASRHLPEAPINSFHPI
jgi:hypothetical protein